MPLIFPTAGRGRWGCKDVIEHWSVHGGGCASRSCPRTSSGLGMSFSLNVASLYGVLQNLLAQKRIALQRTELCEVIRFTCIVSDINKADVKGVAKLGSGQ